MLSMLLILAVYVGCVPNMKLGNILTIRTYSSPSCSSIRSSDRFMESLASIGSIPTRHSQFFVNSCSSHDESTLFMNKDYEIVMVEDWFLLEIWLT